MTFNKILNQNVFINILVVAIVGGAAVLSYLYFKGGEYSEQGVIATDPRIAEIKASLNKLEKIELDRSVIDSRLFKSLVNHGIDIPEQEKGVSFPFSSEPF